MAEKSFAITPSVNIARSKFDRVSTHKTAIRLGDVVPIYCDEVLPGDTRSIDYGSLIRMSTPIAPIMDDIDMELFAFFVPNRLTWENWKEFCGENTSSAGISNEEYFIPQDTVFVETLKNNPYSIGTYLGLNFALLNTGTGTGSTINPAVKVSALPRRAYLLICNRWFRNQNVEAPAVIDLGNQGLSTSYLGSAITYDAPCWVASKKADYFTKALPYAQKGSPVMLPLGTKAPIVSASGGPFIPVSFQVGSAISAGTSNDLIWKASTATGGAPTQAGQIIAGTDNELTAHVTSTSAYVNLANATAATINQLREAYALQLALEKDALYGTRYWEILYGHFGVRSPDSTLQDPEFLGHAKININIEQVLQTTGYQADADTGLAAIGANSVSGNKGNLFTKSFTEHGYLFIMAVARHRESYSQGLNKMFTRKRRYDFYWPVFAHLGAQPVFNYEVFNHVNINSSAYIDQSLDDGIFGYQEAWAEYRYKPNMVSSIMNPALDNSLEFWTLASKFETLPTLSTSFTKVNRNSIARALTSGSTGPDFICDFFFRDTAVRPMPLYSIPGLLGEL